MGKQRSLSSSSSSSSRAGPGQRAWRLLRLALLWARKGGVLKCRLMAELRHGAKYLKAGLHSHHHKHTKGMIRYGERELSFDDTPVIHLKMSRPNSLRFIIPCIKPHVVDFDYDFGDDDDDGWCDGVGGKRSFLGCGAGDCDEVQGDDHQGWYENDDEGIDDKAEEFINRFYQQIKLQKEISFQKRQHNAAIPGS